MSSHAPWTRIPQLIDWNQVGDGSVFNSIPVGPTSHGRALWSDHERVRAAYGRSIEYTLNTLVSFVQHYGDDDLVLVVLGDHQPWTIVTGHGAEHDVPISIIAHDPAVLNRIAGWGWKDGLRPSPQAPVWPMERLPRPLPQRVRLATGAPVARRPRRPWPGADAMPVPGGSAFDVPGLDVLPTDVVNAADGGLASE